jgi:probable HAF family extracellular repeat protein
MRKAAFCTILLVLGMSLLGALPAAGTTRYTCKDLGTLYGGKTYPYGINAVGQVVGSAYNPVTHLTHAFIYSGGVMQDLNGLVNNPPAEGPLLEATGINDRGQIIAYGNGPGGFIHAYLLTPMGSPASLTMLLLQ